MKSWEYRPKPKKHVALCYAKETPQHKGSKEPFSNLEDRALSMAARDLQKANKGDEVALGRVRGRISHYADMQRLEGRWDRDSIKAKGDKWHQFRDKIAAALIVWDEIPTDYEACRMLGLSRAHYPQKWKPRIDEIWRKTVKSWRDEV